MPLNLKAGDMPFAETAEQTVLGAIMLYGIDVMGCCARLRSSHFYRAIHREIYQACIDILAKQTDIATDLVLNRLPKGTDVAYVCSLTEGLYRGYNPSHRVDEIIEAWKLRRGLEICDQYSSAFVCCQPANDTLSAMQTAILNVVQDSAEEENPHVSAFADDIFESLVSASLSGVPQGYSYGDPILDKYTGGMQPSQVTVVGARSGVGKSSLMKQAAVRNCRSGVGVLLMSLEMTRKQIFDGLYAITTGIEYRKIVKPYLLRHEERDRIRQANEEIKTWPLWIYDKAEINLSQMVAYGRMHMRRDGVKLLVVDYAQNVEVAGSDERSKVRSVSRSLTKLVKDEKAHLMLLSQLRKPQDDRGGGASPPTPSQLRESGQLENDAHVILLLHRPWDPETGRVSLDGSLIIPKMRENGTGTLNAVLNTQDLTFTFSERP